MTAYDMRISDWSSDVCSSDLVQSIYENWLKHAPQLADIQRMDCTQPGECNHGMMLHFGSTNFPAEFGVPAFAEWLQANPPEGQYRTHKRMLQQFQWKEIGRAHV